MTYQKEAKKLLSKQLEVRTEDFQIHGNYITNKERQCENAEVIKDLLKDNNKYCLIIAPTGTGKTSTVLSIAKEMSLDFVSVSPLVALTEQTANKIEIPLISKENAHQMGMSLNTYIEEMGKNCAAVFDKLRFIIENNDIENKILIVDEAHHLITSSGYRSNSLRYLEENLGKFKKVIFLTGTPEVLYLHKFIKNARIIRFKYTNTPSTLKYHYRIIPFENMGLKLLYKHISRNPVLGKTIVFINNLNGLLVLKKYLINSGVDEKSIFIAHSGSKQNEYFKYLVYKEKIHDDIQYFLTTSVISDGVNINNTDIDSIYLYELNDLTLLRQIIKRPRKKVGNIYDFISLRSCDSVPDVNKLYEQKLNAVELILEMVNKNKSTNPYFLNYLKLDCKTPGIYFNKKNIPSVYESEIIRMVFEEFYDLTLFSPEVRRKLILELEGWSEDQIIIEPKNNELPVEKFDPRIQEEIMRDIEYMTELFFDYMTQASIKYYLSYGDNYTKRMLGIKGDDIDCKQGYEIFKNRFNDISVKQFKDRIEFLSKYNFSQKALKSILRLPINGFMLFKGKLIFGELVYLVVYGKEIIENNGFDIRFNNLIKEIFFIHNYLEKHNYELRQIDQFNSQIKQYCHDNNFESSFGTRKGIKKILLLKRNQRIINGKKENYYTVRFNSEPHLILEGIHCETEDENEIRRHFETAYSNYMNQTNINSRHLTAA